MKFVRVPQPRVPSREACSKTVHTRAQCISSIRGLVSAGDTAVQLKGELQACSSQERQELLDALLKDGCRVVIPPDEALAMKADLGIPWSKLRVVRRYVQNSHVHVINHKSHITIYRWMKSWKVEIGSEPKMRKEATALLGNDLIAESVPFSFPQKDGGEEIKPAALVYVPNLWRKIEDLLEQNEDRERGYIHILVSIHIIVLITNYPIEYTV